MSKRKLPLIHLRGKTNEELYENRGFVHPKSLTKTIYNRTQRIKADPCDAIVLPIINDRIQNDMKHIAMTKRHKNYRCNKAVRIRRESYLKRLAQLDEKWKALQTMENSLRSNMILFNRFLRQNLVKRERFIENINHYRNMNKKYEEDICEITERNSILLRVRTMMKEEVQKHSIYYNFLMKVLHENSEYKSVSSLIDRFETLFSTTETTIEKYNKDKSELEDSMFDLESTIFEKCHVIHNLLYQLGVLSQKYAEVKRRTRESDKIYRDVLLETSNLQLNLMITKDFISVFYSAICERQGRKKYVKKDDSTKQLCIISNNLKILNNIIKSKQIGHGLSENNDENSTEREQGGF